MLFEVLLSRISVDTSFTKVHTMIVLAGVVQQTIEGLDLCVLYFLTISFEKKVNPSECLEFEYPSKYTPLPYPKTLIAKLAFCLSTRSMSRRGYGYASLL